MANATLWILREATRVSVIPSVKLSPTHRLLWSVPSIRPLYGYPKGPLTLHVLSIHSQSLGITEEQESFILLAP